MFYSPPHRQYVDCYTVCKKRSQKDLIWRALQAHGPLSSALCAQTHRAQEPSWYLALHFLIKPKAAEAFLLITYTDLSKMDHIPLSCFHPNTRVISFTLLCPLWKISQAKIFLHIKAKCSGLLKNNSTSINTQPYYATIRTLFSVQNLQTNVFADLFYLLFLAEDDLVAQTDYDAEYAGKASLGWLGYLLRHCYV